MKLILLFLLLTVTTQPTTKVGVVRVSVPLDIVTHTEMRARCLHLSLKARGCFTGSRIVMHDYRGSWPISTRIISIPVQYESWGMVGNRVWMEQGTLHTYNHHIMNRKAMSLIGDAIVKVTGLPTKYLSANTTLGHEFWHAAGHNH